jgi:hypothetical protein
MVAVAVFATWKFTGNISVLFLTLKLVDECKGKVKKT